MTEYFYDKTDDCIWKTSDIKAFYENYWNNEYKSFQEYLQNVYPNIIWIVNYTRK